ncbi:MAG: helix-turn-helix domain-containing protein [Candidatus Symbiothrix sp.]|jgi:HTH-type transcriptional regulator/antitoxin HigA|nr:helix-turn-helix domain-containing protein [Candidatus Symbiothrix sp.]
MIHNKKQLTIALKDIESLRQRMEAIKDSKELTDLWQIYAYKSRIEDLSEEIEEFKFLTSQNTSELEFSEEDLPKAVISLRIASGLTQKQLANAIEVQEQQIQRYEQNDYRTASFERIVQIVRVLSRHIELKIELKKEQSINRFTPIIVLYPKVGQIMKEISERGDILDKAC